jgi:hypothetical protein
MNAYGWIYNYDPFPNRTGIRSIRNRPCAIVLDDWRGGQVVAIDGDAITVRLHLEHALLGTRTVDRAVFTAAGLSPIVGDACAVRVEGASPDYVVVAVHSAHFIGGGPARGDQVAYVARGELMPGCCFEAAGRSHVYEGA